MKIGLVFDDSIDRTDGVAQYVLTLGSWLTGRGHDVHYLVGNTKRTDIPNIHSLSRSMGVRFNKNQLRTPLPASKQAIKTVLDAADFDILHVQMPYSPFMAARVIAAAPAKTAIVGTFHILPASSGAALATKLLGVFLTRNLKRFSAFISVSPAAREFARKSFGIESEVIPNTAPLDRFFAAKPFAAYAKHRAVVFVGRLVERKGCQYLLRAVARLKRENRWPADAKVVICGDGPMRVSLTAFVHENSLTEIVDFKGFVSEEDKPRYMASADIAVFPSPGGESFGIVLIEAMAAARGAVLAGDNPGYAWVMKSRPDSVFNPLSLDALAEKLAVLLEDKAARNKAAEWQKRYAQQFVPDVIGKKILSVYKCASRAKSGGKG